MKGGNWLTNLFGYGVEHAEPQTVELDDGFPFTNVKFCGSPQDIMAVIQKNKLTAQTSIPLDHDIQDKHTIPGSEFIIDGKEVFKKNPCKKYTYKEVYNQSKKVDLVYYPRKKDYLRKEQGGLYFLRENAKYAYILSNLWGYTKDNILKSLLESLDFDTAHTMIGILLSYKKKDIRAWVVMGLQDEFDMDFWNLDQRKEFIEKPEFQKRRDEIAEEFENTWKKANEKLKEVEDTIEVPDSWMSELKTLEPPKSTSKTAGHRKHLRKTRRR